MLKEINAVNNSSTKYLEFVFRTTTELRMSSGSLGLEVLELIKMFCLGNRVALTIAEITELSLNPSWFAFMLRSVNFPLTDTVANSEVDGFKLTVGDCDGLDGDADGCPDGFPDGCPEGLSDG